jgi:hypothetical protein
MSKQPQVQGSAVHNLVRIAEKIRGYNALGTPLDIKRYKYEVLDHLLTKLKSLIDQRTEELSAGKISSETDSVIKKIARAVALVAEEAADSESKRLEESAGSIHNLVRTAQKLNNKLAQPVREDEKKINSPEVLQRFLKDCFKNSNARILVEIEGDGSVGIYVCDIKEELIEKTKRSLQEYVENLFKHYDIITTIPIQYHAGPYCMEGWGGIR